MPQQLDGGTSKSWDPTSLRRGHQGAGAGIPEEECSEAGSRNVGKLQTGIHCCSWNHLLLSRWSTISLANREEWVHFPSCSFPIDIHYLLWWDANRQLVGKGEMCLQRPCLSIRKQSVEAWVWRRENNSSAPLWLLSAHTYTPTHTTAETTWCFYWTRCNYLL